MGTKFDPDRPGAWHTLTPVGADARALPDAGLGDGSVLVEYRGERPTLDDDWQEVVLSDRRTAWVRRADCGLGCRCAGEVRLSPPWRRRVSHAGKNDSAPSVPDPVADTARALAGKWLALYEEYAEYEGRHARPNYPSAWGASMQRRFDAIRDAARACGPQVEACFRALVTGDAGRAPGVEL